VIDHLVIGNRKQVALRFCAVYFGPVDPHFFESRLNNIARILFVPKIFKDEAVHVVGVLVHTLIVFSFCHKQGLSKISIKVLYM
jgi:hypothetical protein